MIQPASVGNPWGPVVDIGQGAMWAFLPETPKAMRQQGRFKYFKVMAGLNKDDGSYFIRKLIFMVTFLCWGNYLLWDLMLLTMILTCMCTVFTIVCRKKTFCAANLENKWHGTCNTEAGKCFTCYHV